MFLGSKFFIPPPVGSAAVRIIATDSKNDGIVGASTLQIELITRDQKAEVLFRGPLNRRGTAEAQFRFPAGTTGTSSLRYVVDTPIGSTEFTSRCGWRTKSPFC